MKTFLTFCLCCVILFSKAAEKPILISAQWVKEHLKDPNVVLIHVSYSKYDYDAEHIPGAQYLWPEWLAPNTPETNYNAPDKKIATDVLQRLGISDNSHVVLYNVRNEVSVTARMFLTLEHFGLKGKVSFLNGGLEAWKKDGNLVTKEVPPVKKGNFIAKPGNLLVDKNYVLNTIKTDKGLVVDARATRFYDGEPVGYPRDGHIAGAKNIVFTELVDQTNHFKSTDSLKYYFSPVAGAKEVVTYCFIGQTASVVYMAGRILGYDMKLYDGSMQEWSRFDELPMEKTEK